MTTASRYLVGEILVRRTYAPGALRDGMSANALRAAATIDGTAARVVQTYDDGSIAIRTGFAVHALSDTDLNAQYRRATENP